MSTGCHWRGKLQISADIRGAHLLLILTHFFFGLVKKLNTVSFLLTQNEQYNINNRQHVEV